MENVLIFASEKEVRFTKLLKFIVPTYLTSLFNTVYTIIDGIFVSTYVGTNALASINIVYPIVNVLTGIALVFATGGSAVTALHIGGNRKKEADRSFSVSSFAAILLGCLVSLMILTNLSAILTMLGATPVTIAGCKTYARWWLLAAPVVIGKELFTYFIRVDGAPTYSFITALSGGILNIVLDYILVGQMQMGIYGAALATILGLVLSFSMGIYYFIHKQKYLSFTFKIAAGLERDGILTGAGGKKWHTSTINKILRNEKYIGDALLQKTYTTDFLNKTRVKNNGLVPQYYVEGDHEAIIPKDIYLQVQEELVRRRVVKTSANGKKRSYSCNHCFSQIVICGECGEMFRRLH